MCKFCLKFLAGLALGADRRRTALRTTIKKHKVNPYIMQINLSICYRYLKPYAGTEMGKREINFLTGRCPGDFLEYSALW